MFDDCKCHMVELDILGAMADSGTQVSGDSVTRTSDTSAMVDTRFGVGSDMD